MRAKIVWIILDGVGDTTHRLHDNRSGTALQLAKHPNLDQLAEIGVTGLMDAVAPGFACGSDTAHLSLFGYPPFTYYNGRGAFEALGGGMDMRPGDIAFKSNFSTMVGTRVVYRRCDRSFEREGPILCKYLDGIKIPEFPEVEVTVSYATEHRCAVSIRAPGMSDKITGTDPIHDGIDLQVSKPMDSSPEAAYTAKVVNALSDTLRKALEGHPINLERQAAGKTLANVILLRGPGMRLQVPTFEERHGLKAFLIAPTAIIAGLGISVGLTMVKAPGATGGMDSNVQSKAEALLREMGTGAWDMGIVHIKGIDDASHDGRVETKAELISQADAAIGTIVAGLKKMEGEFVVAVAADHSTSSTWLDHSFEPVPVIFARIGGSGPVDSVKAYDEISCARGGLGRFCGSTFVDILKVLAGYK